VWTAESTEAMQQLKTTVTTALVLMMSNFSQPICIECNASGTGIGAVLSQKKQPIVFFSKALAETSLTKSIYEKKINGFGVSHSALETIYARTEIHGLHRPKESKVPT